jgi:hypothetical protein
MKKDEDAKMIPKINKVTAVPQFECDVILKNCFAKI